MLKAAVPDPALLAWLNSAEGILWHAGVYKRVYHAAGMFGEIKNDHECDPGGCSSAVGSGHYFDGYILKDLDTLGISGVPEEWKQRLELLQRV